MLFYAQTGQKMVTVFGLLLSPIATQRHFSHTYTTMSYKCCLVLNDYNVIQGKTGLKLYALSFYMYTNYLIRASCVIHFCALLKSTNL